MIGRRQRTGLLAGRNGWLFWIGKNLYNLKLYRRSPAVALRLRRWRNLVLERERRCRSIGARYLQLMIPDKLSVYEHKLVGNEIDPTLSFALRLQHEIEQAGGGDSWIDLLTPLRAQRDIEDLCLRTDTHFTPAGFRLAYQEVCRACGVAAASQALRAGSGRHRIVTDLGSKLEPSADEECEAFSFERNARRIEENALTRFREAQARLRPGTQGGSRIVLRNDAPGTDPRCLVMFGDSYAFHETGLGPMLAESFREVHLLWSTGIDFGYVARVRPDLVIAEIAERFVVRFPRDDIDVGALADARLREAGQNGRQS